MDTDFGLSICIHMYINMDVCVYIYICVWKDGYRFWIVGICMVMYVYVYIHIHT